MAKTGEKRKSSTSTTTTASDNESTKKLKSTNNGARPSLGGSTLVTKLVPDTILISRKGEREYINTPKTFIELKQTCREMYESTITDKSAATLFSDLSNNTINDEITYQKFLSTSGRNVLLCYFTGESVLDNGSEEILVDVTPSKNILLKAGTSEYNFANAIAEFIDNSIQAVRLNPVGKRDIKVSINRPNSDLKTTSIRIWDNGCGMNKDHLQRWATMGLSQADLIQTEEVITNGNNQQLVNINEKATGLISRFGVGGKKAAFYLGTEVIVNTKVQGNDWINQAKISLDILNSTGDQEWRIPIIVREANTADEKKFDQFTEVVINNVNMNPENYESLLATLGRDLAHIYYYYLHDVGEQSHFTLGDNNSPAKKKIIRASQQATSSQSQQPTQSQNNKTTTTTTTTTTSANSKKKTTETQVEDQEIDNEDCENDELSDSDELSDEETNGNGITMSNSNYLGKKNSYKLLLNDIDLSDVNDCIESLYIRNGKKFKIFEFSIPIKDPSNVNIVNNAKVVCHLRYFPFLNEQETMPIPNKILNDAPEMDLKTCPLSLRKPGFQVFWNGRLISEAHIDRLGFMATGQVDGSKIEEKWIQRVKGSIFLTSHFPVTHNKMHIIKESPVFDLLDTPAAGGKVAKIEWKRWLMACHKLDQDIQFKGAKYDTILNKTFCDSISVRGLSVAIDDAVSISRGTTKGVVKSIYFIGRPDYRASDFYCELDKLNYKQIPTEAILCSKINKKISKPEYQSLIVACKKKLPSKIKFYEGDKANLPKQSYLAGERIKWVSITLMDSQNPPKEVERRIIEEESYKVLFHVIYQPTGEVVHKMETSVFYESSRVSFGDIDCFQKTGAYSLVFECNDKNIKKATHFLQVKAGLPTAISVYIDQDTLSEGSSKIVGATANVTKFKIPIAQSFPNLVILLMDNDENPIDIEDNPKKLTVKAFSTEQSMDDDDDVVNDHEEKEDKMIIDDGKEIPMSKPALIELVDGQLVVQGLVIPKAELNDESELPVSLVITMDNFRFRLTSILLVPSDPVKMTFTEQITFLDQINGKPKPNIDQLDGYMNLTYLPHFYVFVNDKDGNICRLPSKPQPSNGNASQATAPNGRKRVTTKKVTNDNPPYYILVRSSVFDENIFYVGDESGCFSLCTYNITGILRTHRTTPPPTAILINEKVDKEFEMDDPTSGATNATTKGGKKSTTTNPINSFSVGIITFTLFKDSVELFTCSQKIKVLPSWKPAYITLHPLTDIMEESKDLFTCQASAEINYAIKVLGAGGGNRGPFILNGLIGTVGTSWSANKTEFKMSGSGSSSGAAGAIGTRSSSAGGIAKIDKENSITPPGSDMIILPTIVADRNTRYSRYTITLEIPMNKQQSANNKEMALIQSDSVITLQKDFSIQTVGGAPCNFVLNLGRGVGSARCDSEITLEIGLNDRRHNPVVPTNLKTSIPIEPWFELSNQTDQTNQIPCFIKSQTVGEFDMDKQIYPCKVTVVGFGKLTITVIDKSKQINQCSMNFDCIEGRAAKLCVNGQSNTTVRCSGGQLLDEITFLVCDTQGNPTRSITGIDTDLEWVNLNGAASTSSPIKTSSTQLLSAASPIDIRSRVKISKGEGKLSNLEVKTNAEEGTYVLRVKPKQLDIQEALVTFIVNGKYSIQLLQDSLPRISPTQSVCTLNVMLLDPEKKPMVVPKETMKLITFSKTYSCNEVTFSNDDETKPVYQFHNVAFPKKAGPTTVTFTHSVRGTKGTKIQLEQVLVVNPDFPTKLTICGAIKFSSASTCLLGTKVGIIVTDQFENSVAVTGSIRVEIECSPDHPLYGNAGCIVPTFDSGSLYLEESFKNNDGEATFEQIKLRGSIGSSGPFLLVFKPSIPSAPSIEQLKVEFFYQNQKESLDKKIKLQQERVLLGSEINEIDKEIDELRDQQTRILNDYQNSKCQADDIFNQLVNLFPNIGADAKTNPETIKRLIGTTNQEIDDMSSGPRRRSPFPSNPTSRELLDKSRSNSDSGIVGIIMDIICVEDERLGTCLSNFLKSKMEGCVFQNKFKFEEYYNHYSNNRSTQPVFFISLDSLIPFIPKSKRFNNNNNNSQSQVSNNTPPNQLEISTFEGAPLNGFKGHVVNIIQLREKHEYLRATLCFTLFKETMIFQTVRQGLDYKNYLATKKIHSPPIICLENGEFLDSSGFVEIGRNNSNTRPPQFILGQLPINESAEYSQLKLKKNVLEEYRLIKHKMHSSKKGSEVQDYITKIDQLKNTKKDKTIQLQSVTKEISSLD